MDKVMPILGISLVVLVFAVYTVRILRNKLAPVKTVKAVVVSKQKTEVVSKYSGSGKTEKYAVTFLADGKRLSFYVSELSYNGYHKNESGLLKYKGDRIIDFS